MQTHDDMTNRSMNRPACGRSRAGFVACAAVACLFAAVWRAAADGCFVWNGDADIREPTQKAIILHDRVVEDLVLQVRYDGPSSAFGWVIPVPGKPEVALAPIECFRELSEYTQRRRDTDFGMFVSLEVKDAGVEVLERRTIGVYDVAVLAADNSAALLDWLGANAFVWPREHQDVLDHYVEEKWHFVAVRVDPRRRGEAAVERRLQTGELNPLRLSFPSKTCVFPLRISRVNGTVAEVHDAALGLLSPGGRPPSVSGEVGHEPIAAYWTGLATAVGEDAAAFGDLQSAIAGPNARLARDLDGLEAHFGCHFTNDATATPGHECARRALDAVGQCLSLYADRAPGGVRALVEQLVGQDRLALLVRLPVTNKAVPWETISTAIAERIVFGSGEFSPIIATNAVRGLWWRMLLRLGSKGAGAVPVLLRFQVSQLGMETDWPPFSTYLMQCPDARLYRRLVEDLGQDGYATRSSSARVLGRANLPGTVELLSSKLRRDDPCARDAALGLLYGPDRGAVQAVLDYGEGIRSDEFLLGILLPFWGWPLPGHGPAFTEGLRERRVEVALFGLDRPFLRLACLEQLRPPHVPDKLRETVLQRLTVLAESPLPDDVKPRLSSVLSAWQALPPSPEPVSVPGW